ncbi:MAG: hypothetical protein HY513_04375 [Candidatus Aenigmarchaeota archaeon]|nr:hypothetical protein [Candidatus Aenigmarchaeota archaeon]
MKALIIILSLIFAIFAQTTFAATIQDWSINVEINEDRTSEWVVTILYNETVQKADYFVLADLTYMESKVDDVSAACDQAKQQLGTLVTCKKPGRFYYFKFKTGPLIVRNNLNVFKYDFSATEFADKFTVNVKLPLGGALVEKALLAGTGLQPFEPSYGKEGSDGRQIFLEWSLVNPKLGETIPVSIIYEQVNESELFTNFVIVIAIVIALFIISMLYFFGKKGEVKDVLPVLTQPERRVVEILIRDKEVDQRQIVKETEYSKAKVTRIIQDMEARGILEKIRKGRKNIVELKKELKTAKLEPNY